MQTGIQYYLYLLLAVPCLLITQYKSTGFQARDGYSLYSLEAGATLLGISNLQTTIRSKSCYLNNTLTTGKKYRWTTGIFYNYRSV